MGSLDKSAGGHLAILYLSWSLIDTRFAAILAEMVIMYLTYTFTRV